MSTSPVIDNGIDMQEMKIKYGGGKEIDANTYINSLLHFTNVVQEVNKGIGSDRKVEVKIKANQEGSFVVDLLIESSRHIDKVKEIFSPEHIAYAKILLDYVSDAYKIAKHLRGKKPKEITSTKETTRIENNYGEINNFDFRGANIYFNSPVIQEAISQEFETLENDTKVTSLEFLDKKENPILEVERKDFYELSSSGSTPDLLPSEKIETVSAMLNISSLDLELKKKWDFYYLGNKISAKINDVDFGGRIKTGERFGLGDTFEVTMDIRQQFDESVNAFINKSYTIIKVLNHIEKPSQGKIDFPK